MDLCNISTIKHIQKIFDFRNRKSLGQNFLIDRSVIDSMVEGSEIQGEDLVIEIGPGIGVLTDAIAQRAGKVLAIELDKSLIPVLRYTLGEYNNIEILNEDILKVNLEEEISKRLTETISHVKIMGNLPYYITTPIIMDLLEGKVPAESITIMMQKEVAERIMADPGSKTYGALSVAVQFYCETELLELVNKEKFFPAPKVDSAVLKLTMRDEPAVQVKDEKLFFKLVRAGFGQRRKTLLNSLAGGGFDKEEIKTCLEKAGIDGTRRAETLSLQEFGKLADQLSG